MLKLINTVFAQDNSRDISSFYPFATKNNSTPTGFLGGLIEPVFSLAGALVFIYLLMGGVKWLKSGGDKTEIAAAQAMITHAVIGFVLLLFLFLLFRFIPQFLGVGVQLIQ